MTIEQAIAKALAGEYKPALVLEGVEVIVEQAEVVGDQVFAFVTLVELFTQTLMGVPVAEFISAVEQVVA